MKETANRTFSDWASTDYYSDEEIKDMAEYNGLDLSDTISFDDYAKLRDDWCVWTSRSGKDLDEDCDDEDDWFDELLADATEHFKNTAGATKASFKNYILTKVPSAADWLVNAVWDAFSVHPDANLQTFQVVDQELSQIDVNVIEELTEAGLYPDSLASFRDDQNVLKMDIELSGDWKHEHLACIRIMKDLGWEVFSKDIENSDDDYYHCYYVFVNVASAQEEVGKRSFPGQLVNEKRIDGSNEIVKVPYNGETKRIVKPACTLRKGDIVVDDEGDEFLLVRELEKDFESTVDGGRGQIVYGNTRRTFATDDPDVTVQTVYDSFLEEERIWVNYDL